MLDLVLTVFRFLFLALLYFFIFQLIKMIFRDLRAGEQPGEPREKPVSAAFREDPAREGAAPQPGAEAGLVVLASGDPGLPPGSTFHVRSWEEAILGRSSRNTVTLADPFASLEHASVYKSGGQYWLADKGSRNGTFLNEVRINKPTVLANGDRIRIGGVTLQFVRWAYEVESGNGNGFGQEAK
ncbi:MAG: FHA domain-containing protein [Peptococcaceae bacterium]|nr:FHA domain-containing protein [Peptococcaceae bacterium]